MRLNKRCPPPPPRDDHPEPDVNLLSPENAAFLARKKAELERQKVRREKADEMEKMRQRLEQLERKAKGGP